jgi:hypothetical protein
VSEDCAMLDALFPLRLTSHAQKREESIKGKKKLL